MFKYYLSFPIYVQLYVAGELISPLLTRLKAIIAKCIVVACEQAPGGASAEQTFGAKRRAIGACTHSPKSPMSASKFWTQSGDWWIIIIHDVILVSTSGIDKNQNGAKEKSGSSRGLSTFIKLFEIGARTA